MYIERDSRRQTPRDTKTDSAESFEYLNRCLDFLINYIVDCVPHIMSKLSFLCLSNGSLIVFLCLFRIIYIIVHAISHSELIVRTMMLAQE